MRTLVTWSDRGAGRKAAYRTKSAPGDQGPVKRFVKARGHRYGHAIVLAMESGRSAAASLVNDLRAHADSVEIRPVALEDPSDYAKVFEQTRQHTKDLRGEVDVVLSAGTPQMQTIWVVLAKAGFLDARLFQVIPPAFVPNPHPHAIREVRLDFEGFPEIMALRAEVERLRPTTDGIVGDSDLMHGLRARMRRVASSTIPLLVMGETGVGKELVARAIHRQSSRQDAPFEAENCGALSEGVLESELFGHERGAFTGAAEARRGLFERADGGTLFLDEVGELSPRVQAMLLRVLQEGAFRRVGGEKLRQVDVRVIGATHRDLPHMVRAGTFREDLYYRLAGATLAVPPLRERIEDLPLLIHEFESADAPALSGAALRAMRRYRWPGNVRQLRAEVRRWEVFCDETVRERDLSPEIRGEVEGPSERVARDPTRTTSSLEPLAAHVARAEEAAIRSALRATEGNFSQSARILAIDRNTLKRKIAAFELTAYVERLRVDRV